MNLYPLCTNTSLSLLFCFAILLLASCAKENITTIEDEIPEVTPVETIVEENNISFNSASVRSVSALISTSLDQDDNVDNYVLIITSPDINIPSGFFITNWRPSEEEISLQNEVYTGETAAALSQEFIDTLNIWEQEGSNPDTYPIATFDDLMPYFAEGLMIEVTNVTTSSADITLSGNLEDIDGNVVEVEGFFEAELL